MADEVDYEALPPNAGTLVSTRTSIVANVCNNAV
jgi:hypothetical protein